MRTIGETLTPAQRALFRSAWDVDTVDLYSCEETGYLALQCPQHEHYHVQSENLLLEIVDDDGNPCASGRKRTGADQLPAQFRHAAAAL